MSKLVSKVTGAVSEAAHTVAGTLGLESQKRSGGTGAGGSGGSSGNYDTVDTAAGRMPLTASMKVSYPEKVLDRHAKRPDMFPGGSSSK